MGIVASDYMIRPAAVEDLAGIFDIYDYHVLNTTSTAQMVPYSDDERRAWFDRHSPTLHPLVVAVEPDGFVTGWAGLSPWSPREAYRRSAENSVYIHSDRQCRGIGKALMKDLIARSLRNTPVRLMIARLSDRNRASIALHESLGFITVGVLRNSMEKFGELHDVRIMSLEIGA